MKSALNRIMHRAKVSATRKVSSEGLGPVGEVMWSRPGNAQNPYFPRENRNMSIPDRKAV